MTAGTGGRPVVVVGLKDRVTDVPHGTAVVRAAAGRDEVERFVARVRSGELAGDRFTLLGRGAPASLAPASREELIALCRPWNRGRVRPAGYNNGVDHFGWRFPGKTVVRTVPRVPPADATVTLDGDRATVDARLTLIEAARRLADLGKAFHVLPNYGYVGAATPFFVPVHGSGSAVSTLGDTIEAVELYDPGIDKVVTATRGTPAFDDRMYDTAGPAVVLGLTYRVRDPLTLRAESERLDDPTADQLWDALADRGPANVEVRKAKSADRHVTVLRHHVDEAGHAGAPRDALGKVWDRIEETPIARPLFHLAVRKLGYHVELFLKRHELATFWEHHRDLPLNKIQLRMVRADGMPHSPVRDEDAASADLFLARKHKRAFRAFMADKLPGVKTNPGKQSL